MHLSYRALKDRNTSRSCQHLKKRLHSDDSGVQGLDVGNCDIMLHVRVCEGLVRQLDGSIEKRFARKELLYPIQVPKQSRHPIFAGRSFSEKAKP